MRWLRSFDPQLPRDVWLLQLGGVMNSFGNGVVLPFLVIYLHDVRGFGLGASGLVIATSAAAQVTAGVLAGPLVDRLGPRPVLAGGLIMQAVGFGFFPLVREPWHAFLLIAIEGAGSAGFWPSQSTLIARLTPAARRHAAYAQQRVTMNLGIGLGGLAGGLIAGVSNPGSFTVLFVIDAATFLAYVAVLAAVLAMPLRVWASFAADSDVHSYVLLIPFVTAYLLWIRWSQLPRDYQSSPALAAASAE